MVIVFIVLGVVLVSVVEGKKTFDMIGEGVREGLNTVVNLFPTLLGLFLAVNLLRSSGFLDFLTDSFENIFINTYTDISKVRFFQDWLIH